MKKRLVISGPHLESHWAHSSEAYVINDKSHFHSSCKHLLNKDPDPRDRRMVTVFRFDEIADILESISDD